ncbi:anthranilate phosphoribosyltransferase [Tundrisphaera lichenicola]|uniref:anthranilate phosphoribosyltransferase n=1 Tax=Tundrisphaera lichenicola TaxID=2029860 RepID=UPI003EBB3C3B
MSGLFEALAILGAGRGLTEDQSRLAVDAIMSGEAPESHVAAFLAGLRVKGETADELAGAVSAVRERSTGWQPFEGMPEVLDTCGTGGDGANTVNISTASAIVVAACGVPVAKHGNRSASGNSGSSEVLTELGINIEADPATLRRCLTELGITFLFAPKFHPALRFAAPIRRQLPFRTLFNLIGPLANPTRPAYQLIGVPEERPAELMASALARLGVTRAAVVTGFGGLDEVSLDGPTRVRWVEGGAITLRTWAPEEFGLSVVRASDLQVSGPIESASRLRGVFDGSKGPARDSILANAAGAILVAGRVRSLAEGVELASSAIDKGRAADLLRRWADLSQVS